MTTAPFQWWDEEDGGDFAAGGGPTDLHHPIAEIMVRGEWISITSRVRWNDGVNIRRGRDSESNDTDTTQCRMTLDNRDGALSPRNPLSPYFGHLKVNTPIRVGVVRNGVTWWRFHGEVNEWPVSWHKSAKDENPDREVTVEIQCSGIIRRLTQNSEPLKSAMFRNITRVDQTLNSIIGYWPLEEPANATSFSSPLAGIANATTLGELPTAQGFSEFACSDGAITLRQGAIAFTNPAYTPNDVQFMRVLAHAPETAVGSTQTVFRVVTTGSARYYTVQVDTSFNMRLLVQDPDEAVLYNSGFISFGDIAGRQSVFLLRLETSGSDVDVEFRVANLEEPISFAPASISTTINSTTVSSQTAGYIYATQFGNNQGLDGWSFAHVTVVNDSSIFGELANGSVSALLAYAGENPTDRMSRLCLEEGISFEARSLGQSGNTVAMGVQGVKTFMDLFRECVKTDAGLLFEPRDQIGLGYRSRLSLYNQEPTVTFDYSASDPAEVPVPVDDDRYLVNDVFANNESGRTAEANARAIREVGPRNVQDPSADDEGVGRYPGSIPVSITTDQHNGIGSAGATTTLQDHAGWALHLGTWDEERYPTSQIDLHRSEIRDSVIKTNATLALDQGDVFHLTDMPEWTTPDDVEQLVQGYNEFIGGSTLHSIVFSSTPARAWNVAFIDSEFDRLDSETAYLVQAATDTQDTLVVDIVEPDTRWTTDPAAFPFDVRVGGERITVNNVTGVVSDAFERTESNGWGTADSGEDWAMTGGVAANYSVSSGEGHHAITTTGASRYSTNEAGVADTDLYVTFYLDFLPTGGSAHAHFATRFTSTSSYYMTRIQVSSAAALTASLRKVVDGTTTALVATSTLYTYVANDRYRVRFKVQGQDLKMKVWPEVEAEPEEWTLETTDTDLVDAAGVAVRSLLDAGATNVLPVSFHYDDLVVYPQKFHVTRSVNGIVKTQEAGTDVRLFDPSIIQL